MCTEDRLRASGILAFLLNLANLLTSCLSFSLRAHSSALRRRHIRKLSSAFLRSTSRFFSSHHINGCWMWSWQKAPISSLVVIAGAALLAWKAEVVARSTNNALLNSSRARLKPTTGPRIGSCDPCLVRYQTLGLNFRPAQPIWLSRQPVASQPVIYSLG